MTKPRKPKFKVGQVVFTDAYDDGQFAVVRRMVWNKEFGGYRLFLNDAAGNAWANPMESLVHPRWSNRQALR